MADPEPSGRSFVVGGEGSWGPLIAEALGMPAGSGPIDSLAAGDVVFLDAATPAGSAAMPYGNAFSACRAIKREPRVRVIVVLRADDPFGGEIARYCMADGSVTLDEGGRLQGLERVRELVAARRPRAAVDSLLERFEGRLGDERAASAVQRMLTKSDEPGFVERLTDPETGLFDGPFAGFKLDEEFKRATRFHQPLSLVLVDSGVREWPADEGERRTVLAEIASIFLNESRDIDVLARFTETVFLVLLPGTGPDGAKIAARRIVRGLRERELAGGVELRPRAGVATVPHPAVRDRRGLLALAESGLERAGAAADGVAWVEP